MGDVSSPTAENDPVSAALADPGVTRRLLAAAQSFLGRRAYTIPATQRAAEAEAIVSEARRRALQRRDRYDPTRDVVRWVIQFVSNVTREFVKQHKRAATGPPPDGPPLEELAVDPTAPIDDAVAGKLDLEQWLGHLSPKDQDIIRLSYLEDWTFEEIGTRIGMNACAVRVRAHRARQRLRELAANSGEGQP